MDEKQARKGGPMGPAASSRCSEGNETSSTRRSETAMTNTKHTTPQIPIKDIYSVRDAAILLCTTEERVRELATREHDPLPFRCFSDRSRGMFVLRGEFADWIVRNTTLVNLRKLKGTKNEKR